VPHILEHSVLCGSRKYAIKEPFVELMKGSLNTFLNAFTYPDRTCYPVASANLADFYNLVDVYLDAVLHPKCVADPRTFAQEGWHYEVEEKEGGAAVGSAPVPGAAVRLKGVVFNEMKGVYSSPDAVHGRAVQQALFPDNTYAADSGGDPASIPDLTFAEFAAFHARYYHPSNARFWFYGDDPAEERLVRLGAYLDEFERRDASDSEVVPQPLFTSPRRVVAKYAASAADDEDGADGGSGAEAPKEYVSLNWVLAPDAVDLETELALGFLDYLLLGTAAAPLRKALNDSGLGEALIGGGLQDELRQPIFSVGLKGVAPGDAGKVEDLILGELARLGRDGFPAPAVEAAVNTIEFSLRENNTGSFPRGLSLMLRSAPAWIYGRDPLRPLQWENDMAALKARLSSGEDVFRPLIAKFLVDNPHRVAVLLQPDAALGPAQEAAEQARVDAAVAAMGAAGLGAAAAETAALRERQETPDSPEALACIPSLALVDIPRAATEVPTDVSAVGGGAGVATLLTHDLPTSGVLYVEACLPLEGVPARLLPLLPLFCRCLTQMGTRTESFVQLTDRIGRKTGGFSVSPMVSDVRGKPLNPAAYLVVSGKAMADKAGDLLDLASDILLTARLDDRDRFRQMVLESRAGLEAGIVGAGHRFAARRLDAPRSVAGWAGEAMGGLAYLDFIRGLAKRVDADWEGVKADLEAIRTAVLCRQGAVINATADAKTLDLAAPRLDAFLASLPASAAAASCDWAAAASAISNTSLALTVPTQVNYVGKAANLYEDGGYKLGGSAYVASKVLGTSWLWDRVRVSGGAYGGFADFDSHSGQFTYLSYRDPNLLDTLDVYDGTPGWLKTLDLDQDALTKAIVGTIGDIDSYQLPDAKGHSALMRHLLGVTQEERQQRREEVLGTRLADIRAFGEAVACVSGPAGRVVAVTNADRAVAALEARPGVFDEVIKVL
jgi:Zn-dependent M16 (insulinase) family peptidase